MRLTAMFRMVGRDSNGNYVFVRMIATTTPNTRTAPEITWEKHIVSPQWFWHGKDDNARES